MLKPHHFAHYALSCILSLLVLGASSSLAQESFGEQTVRLSSFTMNKGPIRLDGTSESVDLYIPKASTAVITNSWLDLQFIHSIMLLGERSSIRVLFNETTVAQIPYDPDQPKAREKILVPNELWRDGYNKLTITVIQHYIDRCEDPTSPELWTELDIHESVLAYSAEPVARALQLRDLSGLFSPGIGGLNSILLLNSPKADLTKTDSSYLNEALPLVAQALALRRDYSPLTIRHARWLDGQTGNAHSGESTSRYIPDAHVPEGHVLIGTKTELAAILPKALIDRVKGPFLHVGRLDVPSHNNEVLQRTPGIRLIISGVSGEDVILAARALAQMDDGLDALAQPNSLKHDRLAAQASTAGSYFLHPGAVYTFADLGRTTTTFNGVGTKRMVVNLPIPGNFYTHESASVELSLDFSYGAGMGAGSIMSTFLNGEYIQGLEFKKPNGMGYRNYRISLPARMLRPGNNILEFEFSLRPEAVAGECISIPASHLLVQMLDSSSINLPPASPVAIQPNLAAFSATAFPYIADTHTVRSELVVGFEKMLGEALSLAGKLAQLSHRTARQMFVRTTIPARLETNTLLLATPNEMPKNIFASVSDSMDRTQQWVYRLLNMIKTVQATPSQTPAQLRAADLIQSGGLDNRGVLMAMRNPHSSTPTALMVITADNHTLLSQRVSDLLAPQVWSQLKGDLVVWESPRDAVVTMQVGDYYEIGEKDRWGMLILTLANNPWYTLAALLATLLCISLLTRRYLRKREAQKLAE